MECCIKLKWTKKQLLQISVYLSGTAFLIWQIWHTFQGFIEGQTTFSVTKQTQEGMEPPALLFCANSNNPWGNEVLTRGNISDKNWYNQQFYWLNESLNLTMFQYHWNTKLDKIDVKISKLIHLGNNSDIIVEELMHPYIGLCYALTIDDENYRMSAYDSFVLKVEFAKEKKVPRVEITILNPEDRYGILFPEGYKVASKIVPETDAYNEVWIEKSIWKYLPSDDKNCEYYTMENNYQTCKLKMQVDCFRSEAPKKRCDCIPEHAYKTHFERHLINWNKCKTDEEFMFCSKIIQECSLKKVVTDRCPLPCKQEVFSVQNQLMSGIMTRKSLADDYGLELKSNEILMGIMFNSMDVNYHNEVLMQEVYEFIGTVGGSLGLFIGFSYTGVIGKILDHFIKND